MRLKEDLNLGLCVFPLYRGKNTGRGLERVNEEICIYLNSKGIRYDFHNLGMINNEFYAILKSFIYFLKIFNSKNNCYLGTYSVASLFPAVLNKRPLITIITDLIPFEVYGFDNQLKYAIKRWCTKQACIHSNHIIVGSSSIKIGLVEKLSINPDKISIVPWGVDLESLSKDSCVSKIENSIGFLGEIKTAKGIDTLIEAFSLVLKTIPSAKLHIAGKGRDENEMKGLAAKLLPPGSYQFIGFLEDEKLKNFYNSLSLFAFPSRYGFGLSALESQACGTPAIVCDTLDAGDFYLDPMLLIKPGDHVELAKKICQLLPNKALLREKSDEGLLLANQYSWGKTMDRYIAICSEIAYRENSGSI